MKSSADDQGFLAFGDAESEALEAFDGPVFSLAPSPDLAEMLASWSGDRSEGGYKLKWFDIPFHHALDDRVVSVRSWSRWSKESQVEDHVRVHLRDHLLSGIDPRTSRDRLVNDPAFEAAMALRAAGFAPARRETYAVEPEGLRILESESTRCERIDVGNEQLVTVAYPSHYSSWADIGLTLERR